MFRTSTPPTTRGANTQKKQETPLVKQWKAWTRDSQMYSTPQMSRHPTMNPVIFREACFHPISDWVFYGMSLSVAKSHSAGSTMVMVRRVVMTRVAWVSAVQMSAFRPISTQRQANSSHSKTVQASERIAQMPMVAPPRIQMAVAIAEYGETGRVRMKLF